MKDLLFFSLALLYGICYVKGESDNFAASTADDFQDYDDLDSKANASKKVFDGNEALKLIPGAGNVTLSTADWYQDDDLMDDSKANFSKKEFPGNGTVKPTRKTVNIFDKYAEYFKKQREEYANRTKDLFKIDLSGVTFKPFVFDQQNESNKRASWTLYSTLGKIVVIMMIGGGGSACYMRRCKKKSPSNDDDTVPVIPPDSKV